MTKLFPYLAVITLLFFTTSCETDVDLRAPYDDTPIVFGVLDQTVDTQFIKINKSFIGEGNNFEYAAIADCTIFQNVKAIVNEVGGANREFVLKELYVKNIDEGVFYTDSQKVYYFNTISGSGPLDESATYELEVSIDEGRKEANSSTQLVNDFAINRSNPRIELVKVNNGVNEFVDYSITWTSEEKNLLYTCSYVFNYEDVYSDRTEFNQITIPMGSVRAVSLNQDMSIDLRAENFLNNLKQNTKLNNSTPIQRKLRQMYFVLSVSSNELTTYMELSEPSFGVVQDKPSFTNINGGRGIFSSRFNKTHDKLFELNKSTLQYMWETFNWNFCSDDLKYSQSGVNQTPEDFYCP